MHFRTICAYSILLLFFLFRNGSCEVVDSVVAAVDDIAITERDLNEKYEEMQLINNSITRVKTLQTMINRVLLIKDAKRFRMESASDDELIDQYIDLKIRSTIKVTEKEVQEYYDKHKDNFSGKDLNAVSDEIVRYLTELKVNSRLTDSLKILRKKSEVIINIRFEGDQENDSVL